MTVLTNAAIVLPDEVVHGHIVIEDGKIAAIGSGPAEGEDCEGDTIIPGLIELHTDHLEVHVAPRPGVRWNLTAAIQAHDAQMASSGITTVFDALRVGLVNDRGLTSAESRTLADAIMAAGRDGRLRAEHRFHLRCEVSTEHALPGFELFEDLPTIDLVSLMDHTPGQRQFRSMDAYRMYFQTSKGLSDEEFVAFEAEQRAEAARWSHGNRIALAERAKARGAVIASHDDATEDHVAEAVRDGVTLAEFPTTIEAADASRRHGMKILMGGPNLVRGGSHSGNVSAGELAERGVLDILSSDYVPFSLLQSAFLLAEEGHNSLPDAIKTVTATPAAVMGLDDRGRLAQGLRADLVRVRRAADDSVPVVRGVWRAGTRVA
ncbi:MAG: alpha-D-ribose 1-methylphosphonate 5-triphosphate diphosphatase [Pseudomonadota bacterium]